MENKQAKKVLSAALATGADLAELYVQNKLSRVVQLNYKRVDNVATTLVYGAGLRLMRGVQQVYGYTSDLSEASLLALADKLAAYFDGMAQSIISRYDELTRRGAQVVIFCLDGNRELYGSRNAYALGKDYKAYAHNLFAALRRADADLYETVIAEGVNPEGIGESLIARLIKLSGGMII